MYNTQSNKALIRLPESIYSTSILVLVLDADALSSASKVLAAVLSIEFDQSIDC